MSKKSLGDFSIFAQQQNINPIQIPQQLIRKVETKLSLDNVLPPTMKNINVLLQARGFHGVGGVSGGTSDLYVGRYYDKYLGAVLPYPQQQKIDKSLSFKQNFDYKMGQTVNAWNTYVTKQSQLKSYLHQMKTPQRRKIWFQNSIQSMSLISLKYKWVVTLFYAYVFPQIKYKSENDTTLKVKKSSKFNFLGLSQGQQQQLLQQFVKYNGSSIQKIYTQLKKQLQQYLQTAKTKSYLQIQRSLSFYLDMAQNFTQSVTIYLSKQKLSKAAIDQILNGQVNANQLDYGSQNQIKQQIISYLNQNGDKQNKPNSQLKFVFPLTNKSLKDFPKFELVKPNQNYYAQLLQLFQSDGQIIQMMSK